MKWSPKNISRNLNLYYLYAFLGNLDFSRGLFVLFLLSRGLSTGQVGVLQTILFWSNLIAEIPAGIAADYAKRKYSVSFGLVLTAAAALLTLYGGSYGVFMLAFICYGLGFAFRSGADSAILFDGLKQAGSEWHERYVKLASRSSAIGNVSLGIAIATGGVLAGWGWEVAYLAFAGSAIIGAIAILLIHEAKHLPEKNEGEKEPGVIQSLKIFFGRPEGRSLLLFLFGMGFLEASHAPFFIFIQVLFKNYGLNEAWIGVVIASSMAVTAVGYHYADRLGKFSVKQIILVGSCVTSLLMMAFLFQPPLVLAVILYIIVDMIPSLIFVHTDAFIHHGVPSTVRASVLSVHSFVSSIFISLVFLASGWGMEMINPSFVLAAMGLLPVAGITCLSLYFHKYPVREASRNAAE